MNNIAGVAPSPIRGPIIFFLVVRLISRTINNRLTFDCVRSGGNYPPREALEKQTPTAQGNALHTKRIATVWGSELTCFDLADRPVEKEAEVAQYPLKPWVLLASLLTNLPRP